METHFQYTEATLPLFLEKSIENSEILECAKYSILGGKRIRSLIYLTVVDQLIKTHLKDISDQSISLINDVFIYIELLHTSSLILDDMPYMDNDLYRRGQPTVHYKYGKAKAQLTSFIITELAYRLLANNMLDLHKKTGYYTQAQYVELQIFLQSNQYHILGEKGLAGGQYLDLYSMSKNSSLDNYLKMIEYKTARLFELTFILPYCLIKGGNSDNKSYLKQSEFIKFQKGGYLIGMIFQILDDLNDYGQDKSTGKNILEYINLNKATELINQYYTELTGILKEINVDLSDILSKLMSQLQKRQELEQDEINKKNEN